MKEQNSLYLENIADLLWLSKFTGMQSIVTKKIENKKKEKPKPNPKIDDEVEDNEDSSEPKIEEPQNDLEVHTDNQDDNSSHTKQKKAKAIQSPKQLALQNYREWEKAFKFINLKQPSKNRYELDEERTVENIASLGVFDLVFKQVQEKSFFLTIVIDRGETMELWDELIKNFEQMLLTMGVFARISIYYWDTKDTKPKLYADRELKREISQKLVTIDSKRNLVWVMSDCIAPSWRSGESFKSIDRWSLKSFTSILQMFPKEMWMGTMLFRGKHIRLSSVSFNSLNQKLKTKPSKREKNALKIPIVSFDPYALQAWAKVVINAKNNSISGIELEDLDFPLVKSIPKKEITPYMRMQRFYSQASPTAQKLAFYMSVLPIDFKVTRILQEERLPNSNQAHVAEVFLGGLIERTKKENNTYYDFYPKIREELNANISADESFNIMESMSDFVSSHLGIGFDFKALLADPNGVFEGDVEISSDSLAYARLASRVLKRKGGALYDIAKKIDIQTKKYLDSNKKLSRKTSIVQIETSRGHCIGALINYNNEDGYTTVVTTKHLLYNDVGELLEATINNGNNFYDIDLNKVDSIESIDLAILKIRHQSSYGLLNIENEETKIGTMVSILTYNNGREYIYNGEITKTQYHSINSYEITLLDRKVFSGSPVIDEKTNDIIALVVNISLLSGSAVIDTITNKLIGIVSMLDTQNNVIQAIPITKLLNRQFSWKPIVENEQKKPYFKKLQKFLDKEEKLGKNILPSKEHWYSSLDSTGLSDVKVVILGQDPYPTVNHAHGLAFSVLDDVKVLPNSLVNINKELFSDLNIDNSHIGYLQPWAEQGVLLLNSILTVEESKSNSHQGQGWEIFTDKVIEVINNQCHNIVFVLWGAYAQKKGKNIDESKHLILKAPHPSPLSAYRGFFNSKPFSQIDKYLDVHEIMPIEWNLNPKIISGELSAKQINYFKFVLNKRKKELQIKRNNIVHSNINISEVEIKVVTEFDEVHNALEKIKDNLYGICEMCEKSINIQRLKIKPFSKYCINCRKDVENYPSQLTPLTSKLGKDIMLSREKELKEIDELLNKNSILLIHGVAGIGKTTIANYYLHSQKDNFHYYGFFRGLKEFGIDLINSLNLKSKKEDKLFMKALSKLKKLKGRKLLVIDEIVDVENNQEKLKQIFKLKDNNFKILLTSREKIEDINQYYLDALSLEDAKVLFNYIYKVEDEVLLEEILTYLDGNILFIEMTAKVLKSKKTLTLEIIKEKFENGEFSIIKSKRKESFSDNLNQLFTFDELDNEEILILKQLSILPSIEIEFSFLEQIFNKQNNEEFEEILNYLSEKGWLKNIDDKYKLHQTIKKYILSNHLPSFEEIENIVQFFYNSKAKDLKNNLFYIESINHILRQMGKKDEFYNDNISDASCDLCKIKLNDKDFFVDGKIKNSGGKWGNVCLDCFEKHGIQIGKGIGQLYKKNDSNKWLLLAGWEMNITEDRKIINNLRRYIQQNNKREIGKVIQYPLKRFGFIPDIVNEEDFIKRYSQVFDDKLISMVVRASDDDWSEVGYKGTMLYNGEIWISDGKIIAINYTSEEEQGLQQKLKDKDKESIHSSLKDYQDNKLIWVSKSYKIRIDEVANSLYRCAIWNRKKNKKRKPSLILQNGKVTYDGSGGNHYYTFIKSKYKYVVDVNILGYDDSLGELLIYKNDELIEDEKFPQGSDESKGKLGREYKASLNIEDMILNVTKETWNELGFDEEEDINTLEMKEKEKKNLNKLREDRKRKK